MKLEDFFTPLEVTDGLESFPRVEKLVSLMQQDKCYSMKNIIELTCGWSTVAHVLTATQNMYCLKQFIELGGLCYLDKWLQEAQRFENIKVCNKNVEELISSVLDALVKLPMDRHGFEACGLGNTIRHFHSHGNTEIQGKAKSLSDGWEKFTEMNTEFEKCRDRICPDHENRGCKDEKMSTVEGEPPNYEQAILPPPKDVPAEDCTKGGAIGCKPQHSSSVSSSSAVHFEAGMDGKDNISTEGTSGTTSSRNCGFASPISLKEVADDGSPWINGGAPRHSLEGNTYTQHISVKSEAGSVTGKSFNQEESDELDVGERKNQLNSSEDGLRSTVLVGFDDKQPKTESSSCNSKSIILPVCSLSESCQKTSLEAGSCNGDKKGSGLKGSVCIGFSCNLEEHPAKNTALGMVERGSLDYWKKIMEQRPDKQIDSYLGPKVVVRLHGKQGNPGKTSQAVETFRANDTRNMPSMSAEQNSAILEKIDVSSVRPLLQKNAELLPKEETETELDNALEVARRVAREVEQEVGIYRETSGSSSSIESNGEAVHPNTVDSAEPKTKDCLAGTDRSESFSVQNNPDSCCSSKEEMVQEMSTRNEQLWSEVKDSFHRIGPTWTPETDDGLHEQESSQLTTIPEVAANNRMTHLCSFDLNEDIQAEEIQCPARSVTETVSSYIVNVSTPIHVVATSRVPACMPKTPLQFEGELGWRGAAATSAFRPASFCKTPKEKTCLIDENNSSSKRSQGCQRIDLNVANAGDDLVMDSFPLKHAPVSLGLPSGESPVEFSSRRVGRLNLDLNRLGDNDDNFPHLLSDWRTEHKLHLRTNGDCSPSPTSLSRPSIRDFDLNDDPSLDEARPDFQWPGQGTQTLKNGVVNDPTVSIMGTTIQLDLSNVISASRADLGGPVQGVGPGYGRKEFLHSTQPFLMAGPNVLPAVEQMGRVVAVQPMLAYAPPLAFSYNNGFGVGPPVPLPSTIYPSGIVPYMLDTRGAAIIPQILGSGALPSFSGTPGLTDVAGGTGSSDIDILRPNLDSNVGVTSLETESRGGKVRHLFIHASNSLMEEQMKSFQQVAMSGPSLKRKEPECRLESYHVGHKQATLWR